MGISVRQRGVAALIGVTSPTHQLAFGVNIATP
jgi:hypothetical protein